MVRVLCVASVAMLAWNLVVRADDGIAILDRHSFAVDRIPCERIPLGEPDDYKPCIVRLPDGELLISAFHQHKKDGGKVLEQVLLFRSKDGGKSWSPPRDSTSSAASLISPC